jgi:putative hydrolase of the HAD superfamily
MLKAIFFDLDNTILAYDAVAEKSWREVCRRFAPCLGIEASGLLATINQTRDWYWSDPVRHSEGRVNLGVARRELVAIALSRLGINAPILADELADQYAVERELAITPLPGAIDTLGRFRENGFRMALVTNGSSAFQRQKIERFGLAPFFDFILIEGEFGFGKPDERVYLHTLEQLNVMAAEAWMVGDDLERDVEASQKLGIYGIWMDWKGEGLPESTTVQPDKVIKTLSELL